MLPFYRYAPVFQQRQHSSRLQHRSNQLRNSSLQNNAGAYGEERLRSERKMGTTSERIQLLPGPDIIH